MLAFSLLVAALALAVHAALNNGSQPNVCMSMMCRAPLIALQILIFFVDDLGYGLYAAMYNSDTQTEITHATRGPWLLRTPNHQDTECGQAGGWRDALHAVVLWLTYLHAQSRGYDDRPPPRPLRYRYPDVTSRVYQRYAGLLGNVWTGAVFSPCATGGLPLNETTLPEALKNASYSSAILGKWSVCRQCVIPMK